MHGRRDEQGAVGVVVSLVLCFVLLPVAALVIDLGGQRVARADVQSVADVVALDMARTMATGGAVDDATATTRAAAMDKRVGRALTVRVLKGYIAPNATFVSDQQRGCRQLYAGTAAGGYDTYFADPAAVGKPANAVLVTVGSSVGFTLAPWSSGEGKVCQSSIGSQYVRNSNDTPVACYDVGSYALAVNTGNSRLIDPLLREIAARSGAFGSSGTVNALSYTGLASTKIDLDRLALNLGLASVNDLARVTVSLKTLYNGMARAVVDPGATSEVAVLQSLANAADAAVSVQMDRLVKIGNGAPLGVTMNALDMVGGSFSLLNGTNAVKVNITHELPGVVRGNAEVTVVQGPHRFCGSVGDPAVTKTADTATEQLKVVMDATPDPVNRTVVVPKVLGLLGGGVADVNLTGGVKLTISAAPTSTTLTQVRCGSPKGIDLDVDNGVAKVVLESQLTNLRLDTTLLSSLLPSEVALTASVRATAYVGPTGVTKFTIDVPTKQLDVAYPTSNRDLTVDSVVATDTALKVKLLGILSLTAAQESQLIEVITRAAVAPLLDANNPTSLMNTAVRPALGLLGAQLGGSDIALNSVACSASAPPMTRMPYLRG